MEIASAEQGEGSDRGKYREQLVFFAKLAEVAERPDEVVDLIKEVSKLGAGLMMVERNLLSQAYKNRIQPRRAAWRILSLMDQEEIDKKNEQHVEWIREYRQKLELQFSNICSELWALIDEHLIPSSSDPEFFMFCHKMKGDYYRYLAEIKAGDEKKMVIEQACEAYENASSKICVVSPTHPTRLGLALNYSALYHDIMNLPERALGLAKEAHDAAISELDTLGVITYPGSTTLIQQLKDNMTLWEPEKPSSSSGVMITGMEQESLRQMKMQS